MSVIATAKAVKISPRKVGVVVALVRNRTVTEAITILEHTPRRSATAVRKAIESAVANADYNHGFQPDSLYIKEITVTPGPRYKRYKPAAFGRALPYENKTSHIRVVVDGQKRQAKKKPAKASETTKKATKSATKKEAK